MPCEIKLTVIWDKHNRSMSAYSLYKDELCEIYRVYDLEQFELFSFVGKHNIKRWIEDVFMRTPEKIFIDRVIF